MKLIECIPNISEGRDLEKVSAIVRALSSVRELSVLHVDSSADANRTVITFAGAPKSVVEGAYKLIEASAQLIDMRSQQGAHPRIGATDVCPLVPLLNTSMEECVTLARELGERVATELHIPVYLYEFAASSEERKNLANIRRGQYEKLSEKLTDPLWAPDFLPQQPRLEAGATVIGARRFLVAFNVNIQTSDAHLATKIASRIRSLRDQAERNLSAVKSIGWYMEEFRCAQVSLNLTDLSVTGMHHAFEAVKTFAEQMGAHVTGSEVVGLLPRRALIDAGRFYLGAGTPEPEALSHAITRFGLNDVRPFVPTEKILEDRLGLRETLPFV